MEQTYFKEIFGDVSLQTRNILSVKYKLWKLMFKYIYTNDKSAEERSGEKNHQRQNEEIGRELMFSLRQGLIIEVYAYI